MKNAVRSPEQTENLKQAIQYLKDWKKELDEGRDKEHHFDICVFHQRLDEDTHSCGTACCVAGYFAEKEFFGLKLQKTKYEYGNNAFFPRPHETVNDVGRILFNFEDGNNEERTEFHEENCPLYAAYYLKNDGCMPELDEVIEEFERILKEEGNESQADETAQKVS